MAPVSGNRTPATAQDKRLRWLVLFYLLGIVIVIARLWQMQITNHDRYVAQASGQQKTSSSLAANRGAIYAEERDGRGGWRRVPLAVNRNAYLVYANGREVKDAATAATTLADLLKVKHEDLLSNLQRSNDRYIRLKRRIPEELAVVIREKKIAGVYLEPEIERFYPNSNVGSHLTGFVQYPETGMSGQYGIEGYFNNILTGKAGQEKAEKAASGVWIALGDRSVTPAQNGADIVLTIDWTIQYKVCTALDAWVKQHGASGGSVVIIDPKTGAIIAMCGTPNYNPNVYNEVRNIDVFNNPAIFQQYEPGSVFKPITMAVAIEEQKVTPTSTYIDTGEEKVGPHTIRNSDKKAHGEQTMIEVINKSLNTGAIYAMRQAGAEVFKEYVRKFGFGTITEVELSGEATGNTRRLNERNEIYPVTASFGQGITVTPLQMVSAFGALANGGKLMKPHIVQEIVHADGRVEKEQPTLVSEVVSAKTATLVAGMLVEVVENGHGGRAGVPGYYVAGKTGTAQIPRADGQGYEVGATIGSFVGFAPVRDPKFAMIVRVDRPKTVQFAESSAAPLFGDIAKFILQYYEVPPERPIN